MEFRVLGPVEALVDGVALPLGGTKQRVVLASLALEANRVVSTDTLVARIWGDDPPRGARNALFAYISRLRKLLGPGRIQARPPGYVLVADRGEVDALRFADLVDEARRHAADREQAALQLTEALDLWRGPALADLAEYDALQPAITYLEELRLGAVEERTEAEIALGRHRHAVPHLERLTQQYPLRERLWIQLMLALYRSGRQGDALAAYHLARRALVEDLGIDPSAELRRLYDQILAQDPQIDLPAPPSEPGPGLADAPGAGDRRAIESDAGVSVDDARHRRGWRRWLVGGGIAIGSLAVALWAVLWMEQQPATLPPSTWIIGLDMPLSGARAHLGRLVRNAVEMAVDDANEAGLLDGSTLALEVRDNGDDAARAAANATEFVDDPRVIAMIGPWGSNTTFDVLPVTNEAGLLQCSPSATHPGLTKPSHGALELRAARPEAISFVRLAPADDIQALALASFAYRDLEARHALVIDDGGVGRVVADQFAEEFIELGGTTVRQRLHQGADPRPALAPLAEELNPPTLVFFGGESGAGAVALRQAMDQAGRLSTPLLSWDPLLDGSGADAGSYIQQVGVEAAIGSFVAHASLPDHKFSFADAYRQRFDVQPDEYAAAGYACVEIILAAMHGIAPQSPTADQVRELVRGHAVDPRRRYETVLGTVAFDANGDAVQQFVTFYRVEASAADGAGDWVIFRKQDFGPAP